MVALELAAISLGTAVAKTACGLWLGDFRLANEIGNSAIDLVSSRLTSRRDQRRFERLWDQTADIVASRIEPIVEQEFRDVAENERLAAIGAAQTTFDVAVLTERDLFARDLDAGYLYRHLKKQDPGRPGTAGLSGSGEALYDLLMRECAAYVIEVARVLPTAGIAALTELLRREREVIDDLEEVLRRLPDRRGIADFERDYRQLVVNQLDHVEFFGASLSESSRRYPLSIAYLSLTVSGTFRVDHDSPDVVRPKAGSGSSYAKAEDVLASVNRLFVRGQAGLGKTTLLQWIAVQSARSSFPDRLKRWNNTVPFFIPLRRYADDQLPAADRFIETVGRHIAQEMPPGWVQQQLRTGRGLILVDGVDELIEERRNDVRVWLRELVAAFPLATYVVTSRPAAAPSDWLGNEKFEVAEVEPMSPVDVPVFVHRWHQAVRGQCRDSAQLDEIDEYEARLVDAIRENRHLRQLAGYPLLCALLCALHRDRRGQLPSGRMEIYEVGLHMLLERRDRERSIVGAPALSRTQKTLLLQDIAYWLIRNGLSSAPRERICARIETRTAAMANVTCDVASVYRMLLERTGLLREPIEGEVDFVHRSFQEYLAAAEAVDVDDIEFLTTNAHLDQWADVIVMAAGHASSAKREELLLGILRGTSQAPRSDRSYALRLVAVACLETAPELAPNIQDAIAREAAKILPPKTMNTAKILSKSGRLAIDLLARTEPRTSMEVAATIRTLSETGDPFSLPIISRFATDRRKVVVETLLHGWQAFDPVEYAKVVLSNCPLYEGRLRIQGNELALIPGLRYLRHLRDLHLGMAKGLNDLSFVQELESLEVLSIESLDVRTLEPLANTRLKHFGVWGRHDNDLYLDLAPLGTIDTLEKLAIWTRPVTSVDMLYRARSLKNVTLNLLESAEKVAQLSNLPNLSSLYIGHVADMQSLEPIGFLRQPSEIGIHNCPLPSESLRDLQKWSRSLRYLALRGLAVNCEDISGLKNLRGIDFLDTQVMSVEALSSLPGLRRLLVGTNFKGELPDFAGLRSIPQLRELTLVGFSSGLVDLSPLAGVEDLTIRVPGQISVTNENLLGRGSSVRIH